MLERSLILYYFFKIVELFAITFLVILFDYYGIMSFISLTQEKYIVLEGTYVPKNYTLGIMILVACVLATYHLLYNNLFINIRFKMKIQCQTCGLCVYDFWNYLMCECLLNKVPICRDNLTSPWTLGKWIIKWVYLGILCSMISKEVQS